ncbi:MAG: PilN domain-containing protein [Acidobacteriia bacterium]|nr:PilN domain-containing protein [Terriglobia bacterium]
MRTNLNLATKPLETHRRFLAATGFVGAVAALAFLFLGWHMLGVRRTNEETREKLAEVLRQKDQLVAEREELIRFFRQPENASLHDRAEYLNSLIDARSFDWTQMFMDLERVLPGGVRVTQIAPHLERGRVNVKLAVVAVGEESKLKFIRSLEASREFSGVQLLSEQAAEKSAGGDQMNVQLTVFYQKM